MPATLTLHTCSLDTGGPKFHPCRRCHDALGEAGHAYETNVFDKNRPMGLFTKGKRPKLEQMTGQEKLPVLELPDGRFVTGSGNIIDWAKSNPPSNPLSCSPRRRSRSPARRGGAHAGR